ncbi:MAG: BamA/TamA family outer membrane protein [Deltaproteobacteria bacterium]|nr:BamA/TamA family outer membrane protein [Deltaproteobacteria bacterium]
MLRLWLAIVPVVCCSAFSFEQVLCPKVVFETDEKLSFNSTETHLLCGDKNSEAWRTIPSWQAQFFLKSFLQDRGYYRSVYRTDKDRLHVSVGLPSHVTDIKVHGAQETALEVKKKRDLIGRRLTPSVLTEIEKWVIEELQAMGYACSKAQSVADHSTGAIAVEVTLGKKLALLSVQEDPVEGLRPGTLRRYDAFRIGEGFNSRLLKITENRIVSQGVVGSVYFVPVCSGQRAAVGQGAAVAQKVVAGRARSVSIALGANTELGPLTRVLWRHARLGANASSIVATARASIIRQQLDVNSDWYFLPYPSRWFIRPHALIAHENGEQYQSVSLRFGLGVARTWDLTGWSVRLFTGPGFELIRTLRGGGLPLSHSLLLQSQLGVTTHSFEYYQASPRTGSQWILSAQTNHRDFLSAFTAHKVSLQGQVLWNFKDFAPPLWVIGLRAGATVTLTPEQTGPDSPLPLPYRNFLGGSGNLRGFGRNELPEGGAFKATSVYLGWESRFGFFYKLKLEPLVFFDAGMLGSASFSLEEPAFFSTGTGLRWESPIGVLRTTFARGFLSRKSADTEKLSHWQFYLSLGEEF